jgi:truncated hemoglobin YjbI
MGDELAALFYGRLFEIDPSLRSLFRGDMQEQARQLMNMIGVAVGALGTRKFSRRWRSCAGATRNTSSGRSIS